MHVFLLSNGKFRVLLYLLNSDNNCTSDSNLVLKFC